MATEFGERDSASGDAAPRYRRYRAPMDDGAALVEPGWDELLSLLQTSCGSLAGCEVPALGQPLAELAADARRELIGLAQAHTREFCDPPPIDDCFAGPLVVSGHQPELFHPGVWFKNFSLDALAKAAGGVGVHLIIDSDLCRTASVRTPTGPREAPRVESIAFDQIAEAMPYEERAPGERAVIESFGQRVAAALDGLVEDPLAAAMAPDMAAAARQTGNLGLALSRARRLVEGRWGSATLELPLSALADTSSFHRFIAALLADPPRLHSAYNSALADYRRAHRLRSPAQPLPDLGRDDDWFEAPLWVWTSEAPTRRPLLVRSIGSGLELTDRAGSIWRIDSLGDLDAWADLRRRGVKLRSRALITTLYARLVLGDLFLHGIGGAKYDEVTDELSRRLFGFAPPPHATLTATLRLPIDRPPMDPAADARLRRQLRELRYHPETLVTDRSTAAERAIEAKRRAVASPKTPASTAERHRQIEQANAALQPYLADRRRAVLAERDRLAGEQQAAAVLGSREYSLALFPEYFICDRLRRLASISEA